MTQTSAILVVSFGTTHDDTREKTIDVIRDMITAASPEYAIYEAWTSKIIMSKILKREGKHIFNVSEAMEQMHKDGIKDVIIQPTHVLNGIENDYMIDDAMDFADDFNSIAFGNPLLTTEEDNEVVIEALAAEFAHVAEDEALVLMGHGSEHYVNPIYAAMDYQFKDMGYENFFMGTVEAYPSLETVMKMVEKAGYKKVCLAPFMIVAGDHAKNDLAGEDEDSWASEFTAAGYEVRVVLKGLGEYPALQQLFLAHVEEVKAVMAEELA